MFFDASLFEIQNGYLVLAELSFNFVIKALWYNIIFAFIFLSFYFCTKKGNCQMALVEDKGGILLKGKNKRERASEAYTELFLSRTNIYQIKEGILYVHKGGTKYFIRDIFMP